jgi:hypothetical protein
LLDQREDGDLRQIHLLRPSEAEQEVQRTFPCAKMEMEAVMRRSEKAHLKPTAG